MSDDTKKPFNLNMHTARLLMREPFFAALSRRIDKIASTAIPTAGVRVNPDSAQFEMLYNPEFFAQLDDTHKLGVLKHEFYHLIFEHVTNRKPADGLKRIDNIAMDLAINCHIANELPSDANPGPIIGKEPIISRRPTINKTLCCPLSTETVVWECFERIYFTVPQKAYTVIFTIEEICIQFILFVQLY